MDLRTLVESMQDSYLDDALWPRYLAPMNEALLQAECTTVRRAAAFCSQVGHESAGLRLFVEQPTGEAWSWDRSTYRGRGPIQLTWQSNYAKFGAWAKARGLVDDAQLFVNRPELVAEPRWGFLAAAWYWTSAGPFAGQLNGFADRGDILMVSRGVNGNVTTPNGMSDRRERWERCLRLGDRLLPSGGFMTDLNEGQQLTVLGASIQTGSPHETVTTKDGKSLPEGLRTVGPRALRNSGGHNVDGAEVFAKARQKLAYLRAMVMDVWNEVVFDGYESLDAESDPALEQGKYGSPVRYLLAVHKTGRENNRLLKAIATKVGAELPK